MGEMADDALDRAEIEMNDFLKYRYCPDDKRIEKGLLDEQGNIYEPDREN